MDRDLKTEEDIDDFVMKSLPFAVRGTYGGNTPCVEIGDEDGFVICDAGTGLRDLGTSLARRRENGDDSVPEVFHLFLSHFHWDHIQGFPFFSHAFVPGVTVFIYGFHRDIEKVLALQQNPVNFPVALEDMGADIEIVTLDLEKEHEINGFTVRGFEQNHPGVSYGFSFEKKGKKVVYSTDAEHRYGAESEQCDPFIGFLKDAELLVFDAQYRLLDAIDAKKNWGHSSNLLGIEFAIRAGARRLCLFHHEHTSDDVALDRFLKDSMRYLAIHAKKNPPEIFLAYDGLELTF
jgi:phosphoribosyl 1,2-cyclic phosphodiesterase